MNAAARKIYNCCDQGFINDTYMYDYRILMMFNNHKTRVRYFARSKKFQFFSHPYGWSDCSLDDMKQITKSMSSDCRKSPEVHFVITNGGHRSLSETSTRKVECSEPTSDLLVHDY